MYGTFQLNVEKSSQRKVFKKTLLYSPLVDTVFTLQTAMVGVKGLQG